MSRDTEFTKAAAALGHSFDGEIKVGGNYVPLIRDGRHIYISGQVPRVGDTVVVTGRAGSEVADGASELLYAILGPAGAHTRTSVGVYQLPKNATVELDLVALVD